MTLLSDLQDILRETFEGGQPGKPTMFLDSTKADGSGNNGIFGTLSGLSASQASDPTALRLSVASHAAHMAYYLEVGLLFMRGETPSGPFAWMESFSPSVVDDAAWTALQTRLHAAYDEMMERLDAEEPSAVEEGVNPAIHSAYHLGAIRQTVKLLS
ncbi:DinB family protein [Deinococcus sp.]|uniref:DinB family protein n=1 Tax=Deinococcus sp. TaxID=47478 RepID=UPI003B5C5478